MARLGLAGPSYVSRSQDVDAQRTINYYPEIVESGRGKAPVVLYGTPGLSEYVDLVDTPIRGMITRGDTTWVVAGTKVHEISSVGGVTEYATSVTNDGNPVSMAASQDYILLVSGGNGYTLSGGDATAIADADFPANAHGAAYFEGYFIVLTDDEPDRFYYSAIDDPTSWDALSFVKFQASKNSIVGMLVDHQQLWMFGSQVGQAFYNTGDADDPILPSSGVICQQGLAAEFSIAAGLGEIFFVGQDSRGKGIIWKTSGCNPSRISTHAVEAKIQEYSDISDAVAFVLQINGHTWYVVHFLSAPSGEGTWVYDLASELWFEWLSWDGDSFELHRARYHTVHAGLHVVGDKSTGQLHTIDFSNLDDDGDTIRRIRRAPWISIENKQLQHYMVELDLETGVAAAAAAITLSWSDDGGRTFNTPISRSAGASTEYRKRVRWLRLGRSRGRIYELATESSWAPALIDSYVQIKPGAH